MVDPTVLKHRMIEKRYGLQSAVMPEAH